MGDPAGFVIQAEGRAVYHTGDTALFSDMALIQRLYRPRTGLICVGDRFTMGPETAAIACNELLDLELIVPIHWGTFDLLTGRPEDFKARVTRGRVHVATPGQPFEA
jgi:L-ascorbate metabolism protein UlaG (beta-lactamase superfamily)